MIRKTANCTQALESLAAGYRLFARLLYSPLSQDEVENLRQLDFHKIAEGVLQTTPNRNASGEISEKNPGSLDCRGEGLLTEGLQLMSESLHDDSIDDLRLSLNVDYTSSLYGIKTYREQVATPFESVFTNASGLLYGESRKEVLGAMKSIGVKLRDGIDLPEDHLAFELQYLAILCEKTLAAVDEGDANASSDFIGAHREFIHKHILNWIDALAKAVAPVVHYRFYPGVVMATKGFCELALVELDAIEDELAS